MNFAVCRYFSYLACSGLDHYPLPALRYSGQRKIEHGSLIARQPIRHSQRHHPLMNKAPISLSRVVSTCFVNLFCWIYIDSIESILFESMSTPPRPIRVFSSSATLVGHWPAFSIECVVDSFIDVCPQFCLLLPFLLFLVHCHYCITGRNEIFNVLMTT